MNYLHMELKICEACGMLWLRRKQLDGNYCVRCTFRLSSFPARPEKRGGGRPRTRISRPRTPRRFLAAAQADVQAGAR
jgi:hypothetical protein